MSEETEKTAAGEQPVTDQFRPGWCWMTHPDRHAGQPFPVFCTLDDEGKWYEPLEPSWSDGGKFNWAERSCSWRVVPAPTADWDVVTKALQEATVILAAACVDAPQLEPLQAYQAVCAAVATLQQSLAYVDALHRHSHQRIEALTWHLVPGPTLPDADTTVLCQLQDDDEDCWPGYYDGERWISAEGFPFASRVIAWSQPRGVKP